MTRLTTADTRWDGLRDRQRAAVVNAVLASVARGDPITVADLAEEAGMSRPTFYKYFPTLGAAMLYTHRMLLDALTSFTAAHLPDPGVPAVDRLLASLDLAFHYTRQHKVVLQFFSFFDFSFRRFGLTPSEHAELDQIVAASGDRTRELFLEGQSDGSIDPALPAERTIMALSGSVMGLAQRLLIQDEYAAADDEQQADAAHEVLMGAWRDRLRPR